MLGGPGNDILLGDAGTLALGARGGDDQLFGGPGDDRLYGDAISGNEARPQGLPPNVFVSWEPVGGSGAGGNDYLSAGPGNDHLQARAGKGRESTSRLGAAAAQD